MDKLSMFPYIGGKYSQSEWVISYFPKHTCYVEVFMGGASILLNKPVSNVEVANDFDDRLIDFYKTLRDAPDEVFKEAYGIPYARKLFTQYQKDIIKEGKGGNLDPVIRAARYYFIKSNCFSGMETGGLKTSKESNCAKDYYRDARMLFAVADRLKLVTIENFDFRELIKRYDGENTFFYADPPYFGINDYRMKFSVKDHEDLADILGKIKGKCCVSYYDTPEVKVLYGDKWFREVKDFSKAAIKNKKDSGDAARAKGAEVLIMNYQPEGRLF